MSETITSLYTERSLSIHLTAWVPKPTKGHEKVRNRTENELKK